MPSPAPGAGHMLRYGIVGRSGGDFGGCAGEERNDFCPNMRLDPATPSCDKPSVLG